MCVSGAVCTSTFVVVRAEESMGLCALEVSISIEFADNVRQTVLSDIFLN